MMTMMMQKKEEEEEGQGSVARACERDGKRECESKIRNRCKVRVPNTFTSISIAICFAINIFNSATINHYYRSILTTRIRFHFSFSPKVMMHCTVRYRVSVFLSQKMFFVSANFRGFIRIDKNPVVFDIYNTAMRGTRLQVVVQFSILPFWMFLRCKNNNEWRQFVCGKADGIQRESIWLCVCVVCLCIKPIL